MRHYRLVQFVCMCLTGVHERKEKDEGETKEYVLMYVPRGNEVNDKSAAIYISEDMTMVSEKSLKIFEKYGLLWIALIHNSRPIQIRGIGREGSELYKYLCLYIDNDWQRIGEEN